MKNHKWKIYCGSKFIGSGVVVAEDERKALSQVLLDHDGKLEANKSYAVSVGDTTMSTYGDEFRRSAGTATSGSDVEDKPTESGYLYDPVKEDIVKKIAEGVVKSSVARVIENLSKAAEKFRESAAAASSVAAQCQSYADGVHRWWHPPNWKEPCHRECSCGAESYDHDMNGTKTSPLTGEDHAECRRCGFLDPKGTGQYPGGSTRGTDQLVGTAIESGKKGGLIRVKMDAGGYVSGKCGAEIGINERLRQGHTGLFYPPARGGIVFPNMPCLPLDEWARKDANPLADIKKATDQLTKEAGIPYPNPRANPNLKDAYAAVKNGKWEDGFSPDEVRKIRKIVTLQGQDSYLIEGALYDNAKCVWTFSLSDGAWVKISDQMLHLAKI